MISRSRCSRRWTSASIDPCASSSVACAAGHSSSTVLQPRAMALGPRPPVVEPNPVAQQQLREPVTGAHQIQPQRLPRANEITQRFLLGARDADLVKLAGQQQPRRCCSASRASVLTLSPVARGIFDGAATTHSTRRFVSSRARPYPVGPASYATRTGSRQTGAEPGRRQCVALHRKRLQLARVGVQHRRDDLRRVHVQTDEGSSLRHGWFLLFGCGPPRGVQPRGMTSPPHQRGGTGLFYRSDRTDRQSIWSMQCSRACRLPRGATALGLNRTGASAASWRRLLRSEGSTRRAHGGASRWRLHGHGARAAVLLGERPCSRSVGSPPTSRRASALRGSDSPGRRCSSSSLGEEARPLVSGAKRMYGSHTPGAVMLAEGGVIGRDFRKRDEEKFARHLGSSPARPLHQSARYPPVRSGAYATAGVGGRLAGDYDCVARPGEAGVPRRRARRRSLSSRPAACRAPELAPARPGGATAPGACWSRPDRHIAAKRFGDAWLAARVWLSGPAVIVRERPRRHAGRRDWFIAKRATVTSRRAGQGLVQACRSCRCRAPTCPPARTISPGAR